MNYEKHYVNTFYHSVAAAAYSGAALGVTTPLGPINIPPFANICSIMMAPIIVKHMSVTEDGDIYNPLASSPVNASMFPFLATALIPVSPSYFCYARLFLITGLDLASAILRAISLRSAFS